MYLDIEEQYDKIYRYCYFRVRNVQIAEDITQETFLRYLSSRYKDTGRPLAYLYTIARNLCVDEFRSREMVPLDEEIVESGFENLLVTRMAMEEALKVLSEEEQELLLLRYVNELSFSVLCEIYHESRFALHRKLSKILKKLERRLSDEPENKKDA